VTIDEFAHLPAGVYYLRTGHFDLYNLSPPLLRVLAALPVLAARPAGRFHHPPTQADHWVLGYEFMDANPDRYHTLFVLGRLPMIALTLVLVVAVYACGARHLGRDVALAAAALAAFCPTVMGHGHLVGTDVGATLAMFLAAWAALEAFRQPTVGRTLLFGLALGAALLTKFSALTLVPITAALAGMAARRGPRRWRPVAVLAGGIALGVLVVNAGYLGRGSGAPLAAHAPQSPLLQALARGPLGRLPLPLPADFVRGFDRQHVEASSVYPVYFHGRWSTSGWWWYYPAAFALKETLPMLALLVAGLAGLVVRRTVRDPLVAAFLLVPPFGFALLFALLTDINLGVRYLLPAYPAVFLVAASALRASRARAWTAAVVAAVGLHVAAAVAATPHHLAYMNRIAGPAETRWRWLVDSNLDWGQDLRRLRAYLDERGAGRIRLAYFGRPAPEYYGIDYQVPTGPLVPGTYVVSASFVAGREYFLWDHGRFYLAPADTFAYFRTRPPIATVGRSLLVYELHADPSGGLGVGGDGARRAAG
jgi:4-amino-4-deoxy-L-arabinose transferase-like glycosyltransferase